MALNIVELPYSYFPDFNRGRPLFNANIYVGNVDTDPESPANQKQVTARQEDGTEVQIAQPVKTSAGGVPTYNGSPVTVLVDGAYSVKVLDRFGAEEYYSPDVTKGVPLTPETLPTYTDLVFDSVADMVGSLSSSNAGNRVTWHKYYSDRDGGGNYGIVKLGAHTENGGSIFSIDTNTYIEALGLDDLLDPLSWGIKAGAGQDDLPFWNNFLAWYAGRTVTISPSEGDVTYTAPKIKPLRGVSEISDRLDFPSYIQADFSQLIFKRHPDWSAPTGRFLLGFESLYLGEFGGLSIYDEDYAIRVKNNNLDKTKIKLSGINVTNCNFAIETECQSGVLHIDNFRSDACKRFLTVIRGDMVILDDGWISQGVLDSQFSSTIRNENAFLLIKKVIGVPAANTGSEVAWINNTAGRVVIENFRAGGESGGCTLVNNFAQYKTLTDPDPTPTGVIVSQSENYSVDTQGSSQTSCLIRLFSLPNFLEYFDNRGHNLTQEIISWGSSASQQAQIDGLTSQKTNFSYRYDNILEQNSVQCYPDNLSGLFGADSNYPLYGVTGVAGELICDTRLRPRNGQVYEVFVKGAVAAGGSPEYRAIWAGKVSVATGVNAAVISRNITTTEDVSQGGGATFSDKLTVSAVYFDNASTESDFAPISSNDYTVRLKITGWQSGFEGTNFTGYIRRLI